MKRITWMMCMALVLLVVAGCAGGVRPQPEQLHFQVALFEEVTDEIVISLEVKNTGERKTKALSEANAVMELRDAHNAVVAYTPVTEFVAIEAGQILNPEIWKGRLEPGTYEVYWGAPGLGQSLTRFTVVEQEGLLRLGEVEVES